MTALQETTQQTHPPRSLIDYRTLDPNVQRLREQCNSIKDERARDRKDGMGNRTGHVCSCIIQ